MLYCYMLYHVICYIILKYVILCYNILYYIDITTIITYRNISYKKRLPIYIYSVWYGTCRGKGYTFTEKKVLPVFLLLAQIGSLRHWT